MAKNKKKNKGPYAWRLERQTIEMMRFTEYVSIGVSVAGVTAMALSFIQRSTPWLLAAMAILVLTVVLDILYPAYFTLIPAMKEERKPAHDLWHVWAVDGVMFLMAMPLYNLQEAGLLWLLGIACGVVIAVVLGLWAEEFKREKWRYFWLAPSSAELFWVTAISNLTTIRRRYIPWKWRVCPSTAPQGEVRPIIVQSECPTANRKNWSLIRAHGMTWKKAAR